MTKKKTVLLFSILLLGIIGLFSYQNKRVEVEKKEVKKDTSALDSYVTFGSKILKTDENLNRLEDVEFKIKAYNGAFEYVSVEWQDGDFYNYYFDVDDEDISPIALYNMLSPVQKNAIESISKFSDILNFEEQYDCYQDNRASSGYNCDIYMPTALILEETSVPEGYVKDKKLMQGTIILSYSVPGYEAEGRSGNYTEECLNSPVELIGISVDDYDFGCNGEVIEYGDANVEDLLGLQYLPGHKEYIGEFAATANIREDKDVYSHSCYPIDWVNHKGNVSLSATAYVNNGNSFTTKPNQNIDYKIVVANSGTADAIDTTIKAEVPEGFIYVPGSANDNGEYRDGFIEWNIARIPTGTNMELTYKLFAPKEVSPGIDYTSKAILENFAIDSTIESNKTMVRLAFNNPVTGAPIGLILAVLCMAAGVFIITYRSYALRQVEQQ